MTTRTDDAERLARAMGWEWDELDCEFVIGNKQLAFPHDFFVLPAHLRFVGELAEAAGLELRDLGSYEAPRDRIKLWEVEYTLREKRGGSRSAPDLAHAAVRAALAAKGATE